VSHRHHFFGSFLQPWVLKYHEFDKKEGSIVSKILKEDGMIEHNREEVDRLLINSAEKSLPI